MSNNLSPAEYKKMIRAKFDKSGFDDMTQNEILEFILSYTLPTKTNIQKVSDDLIQKFDNIVNVFEAKIKELMKTEGINENSAIFLKSFPELIRAYKVDSCDIKVLDTFEKAGEYFVPRFIGRTCEVFMISYLDKKSKIIKTEILSSGSVNLVSVNIRQIIENSLDNGAVSVVIAHNHPKGYPKPSPSDYALTKKIASALNNVHIKLFEHIVVAGNDYLSSMQNTTEYI